MSAPRTAAGRTLLANEGVLPLFIGAMAEDDHVLLDYVLAIENEAQASTDNLRRDVIDLLGRIDAFAEYEMAHPLGGGLSARWERVMFGRTNVRTSLAALHEEPS